ncbi:hypothetical protein ACFQPG_11180 [Sphingomonas sp. GCM10030256]|uniref:hypothetical protein n=1 Tax=Sphingomonas sp. GCM10030256 TaxID=3273427 RepID=UPI0036196CD2
MDQNPQGGSAQTGTRDETYDLVAVLYHALQGAENCQTYAQDAQGRQELRQFFEQACDQQRQLADQAKQLLHGQLMQGGEAGGSGQSSAFSQFGSADQSSSMTTGGLGSAQPAGASGSNVGASQMSDRSTDSSRNSEMTTGGGGTSTF